MKKSELKIEARLEKLPAIIEFIASAMQQFDIKQEIYDVQLAVDEVCTNIIKYAYTDRPGVINIVCESNGDELSVTITDNGKRFDPTKTPPPDLSPGWEDRKIGGLGIHFVKTMMDEVSYRFDETAGNILTLRKRIKTTRQRKGKH